MFQFLLTLVIAYLIGAFPTAYIISKRAKNIDITQVGSGNVGATNVFRSVGKIAAVAVLLIDIAKGFLAVKLISDINFVAFQFGWMDLFMYQMLLGFMALIGHNWSIFIGFKGGKGIATTSGVLIALSFKIFIILLVIWALAFYVSRIVSFSSIITSIMFPLAAAVFLGDIRFTIFASILALLSIYKHRTNIKRLIAGQENRIKF